MKAKHIGKKTAGKVRGSAASGHGKAGLQRRVGASGKADQESDQQIDEIERTFTLKHEW